MTTLETSNTYLKDTSANDVDITVSNLGIVIASPRM